MRERLAMGIMVLVLIFLFAVTFFVLGRGEYEPGGHESAIPQPAAEYALG